MAPVALAGTGAWMTPLVSQTENLSFDSADYPAAQRFERYRTLHGAGAEVESLGADFTALVRGWRRGAAWSG